MAISHNVNGCTKVTFKAIDLGYSRDGVDIRLEPKWAPIQSDCYGGSAGAPSDAQFMGAVATVTAELTNYDMAEVEGLSSFTSDALIASGTLPVIGTLARAGTLAEILVLTGTTNTYTFNTAILFHSQSVNKGTRASIHTLAWQCWIDADTTRVLFAIT